MTLPPRWLGVISDPDGRTLSVSEPEIGRKVSERSDEWHVETKSAVTYILRVHMLECIKPAPWRGGLRDADHVRLCPRGQR